VACATPGGHVRATWSELCCGLDGEPTGRLAGQRLGIVRPAIRWSAEKRQGVRYAADLGDMRAGARATLTTSGRSESVW
jgi:hypothetical protein